MKVALNGEPSSLMARPNGIVNIRIDPETGRRARPGQEGAMFEIFREEDAPPPLDPQDDSSGGSNNGSSDDLSRQIF
jgi:penicillin-binding protein 1A